MYDIFFNEQQNSRKIYGEFLFQAPTPRKLASSRCPAEAPAKAGVRGRVQSAYAAAGGGHRGEDSKIRSKNAGT